MLKVCGRLAFGQDQVVSVGGLQQRFARVLEVAHVRMPGVGEHRRPVIAQPVEDPLARLVLDAVPGVDERAGVRGSGRPRRRGQ